jgi:hypothetical protein
MLLQVAAYPADAGSSLLGESGAQLLIKALQTPPDAAPLQQQLLSALCSVVATGEAVLDSQDAAQLQAAVHALLSSPDACVAAAASAALGWLERVRCLVAQ